MGVREALTVIGTVVGAYFGNPQLGYAIGAFVGGLVDPEVHQGPRAGDIATQTSSEGVPCPLFGGTAGAAGNLIYKSEVFKRYVEEGGKGGDPVVSTERLYCTFAIRVGASLFDGPGHRVGLAGYIRIWEDEKLVYDVSPESTILAESARYAEGCNFYLGDETQLPDPAIEAIKGVGNVPSYRGRAYIVWAMKDLTDRRGSVPMFRFEVATTAVVQPPVGIITSVDLFDGPLDDTTLSAQEPWDTFSPSAGNIASSFDGVWIVGGSASGPYLKILKKVGGVYTAAADPDVMPSGAVTAVSINADGTLVAARITGSQRFLVYRRTGDAWAALDPPASLPSANGDYIAIAPNGEKVAVGQNSTPYLYHYWLVNDSFLTPTTFASLGSAGPLKYSPDSLSLAVGAFGEARVYDVGSSSSTPLVGECAVTTPGMVAGLQWGYAGAYLITVGTSFSGGNLVGWIPYNAALIDDRLGTRTFPDDQPPDPAYDSAATVDGRFIVVSMQSDTGDPGLYLYEQSSDGEMVAVANQPPVGTDNYFAVDFTHAPEVPAIDATAADLEDVVLATGRRLKMPDTAWSISNLAGEVVRGVVIASQGYTAQDFINALRWVYLLDGADYDGKIHLPHRGGASAFTLTEDDLVDEQDDGEQEESLRNGDDKRKSPIRRPLKLNLMFPNRIVGYQLTKATSPHYADRGDAVSEVTMEVPVVLNDEDEAPQLADKLEKISRADAEGEISRIVHEGAGAKLVAGSVGTLIDRGVTRRVRVENYREGGCVKRLLLRVDRPHAYTSQISQRSVPAPPAPPPSLAGITRFVVLNISGRVDADDPLLGVVIGVQGDEGSAWAGCMVRLSSDGGVNWTNLQTITTRAQIGTLIADLPDASPHYTDSTNALVVAMIDDRELETITDAQFLSEGNPAAIAYEDGSAEVVQFRDAQDDGDNEWTGTTLQRGRLNTVTAEHGTGAKFVLLAGTVFVPLPSSLIGQEVLLQFVSLGEAPDDAPTFGFTWNPVFAQTEWEPANLLLERDGDDISAVVVPRYRYGTEDAPIASANFIGYRWTATDGVNTTASVDTDASSPSITFALGGWGSPVTVSVSARNRFTGAGPSLSEDIA